MALLGWSATGLPIRAQTGAPVKRIGILEMGDPPVDNEWVDWFAFELKGFGFVKGDNVIIDRRYASSDATRLDALARELVALKPDVLVSGSGTLGALAAKRATTTIPIVFVLSGDPVGVGLVKSLAHPGTNVTGNISDSRLLDLKRVQILAELVGKQASIAVIGENFSEARKKEFADLASPRSSTPVAEVRPVEIRTAADYEPAFEKIARARMSGVAINFSPLSSVNHELIAGLIAKHRLPAIADGRAYAEAGILLTYSTDFPSLMKRSAGFVARILKGAKPADIPVEHAARFVLVVNLKTARKLGVRVPPSVLAAAQKIIE